MIPHLSIFLKLHPMGCLSSYGILWSVNLIWPVAAKAVWGTGECFPSPHTRVAGAATLLGHPLACWEDCDDGCHGDIYLIL